MFDAISYSKGASIVDMLSRSTIGRDTLNGVIKRYLKANAYSVATDSELWQVKVQLWFRFGKRVCVWVCVCACVFCLVNSKITTNNNEKNI